MVGLLDNLVLFSSSIIKKFATIQFQNLPGKQTGKSKVERRFRLRNTTDFKRVRATGKAYTHPFFVLLVADGESQASRLGISVHRGYGSAVARNLVKRRIRSIITPWMGTGNTIWDGVIIVRNKARQAEYHQLNNALTSLAARARLISNAE